ncbi:hypothetical protein P879_00152 [Paragonimus westermani]|uniref:Uncharacterized protein n=1 Tax=Paragonimus westermani TaxID=34504 RepID=A0A8T0DX77_9TREM|nr:hypothetical protein P879_00152 [Paragonimus westermani]
MRPIHAAAAWGNPNCLKCRTCSSSTAYTRFRHEYSLDVISDIVYHTLETVLLSQVLVNYGADVNQTDELLCTPLHHAARNGHTKTFEWLDENNADLVKRNMFGQSPADMALANDFPDLADQIVRAGKPLR